jgi:hypothetical protein
VKAYWPDILLDDADQEVRALQLATHAGCCYVISIKGMALVASARWPLRLGLVMPNGMYTLEHHTDGERLKGEKELRAVLFQVLLAVHELHHNGIWHRSLTPRKFMLMAADPDAPFADEEYQLAVIDLADSRMVGELQPGQPMLVREPQPGHEYAHARAPEYVAACTPYDHDTAGEWLWQGLGFKACMGQERALKLPQDAVWACSLVPNAPATVAGLLHLPGLSNHSCRPFSINTHHAEV